MNSIALKERIDFYLDRSRTSRFTFNTYNLAVREAQMQYFDAFKDDAVGVRENLYTLKVDVTPTMTVLQTTSNYIVNHINYPADYHYFQVMNIFVDGVLAEVSPTDDDQLNRQLQNTFTAPTNKYISQREDATGWKIYRGTTGTPTCEFTYLKSPSDFYIGNESDLIDEGTGVLNFFTSYTAVEESVYNGITYNPADRFTTNGVTTDLTSGQVILTSVLVDSNLPETVHEDLAKKVADLMSGSIADYNKAGFVNNEINKNI